MVAEVRLSARDGELLLRPKLPDSWEMVLVAGGKRWPLGGDSPRILLSRLGAALAARLKGDTAGALDGVPVVWALALLETRTTIYVADVAGQRLLFFQDENARVFARMTLNPEERAAWQQVIASARPGGG